MMKVSGYCSHGWLKGQFSGTIEGEFNEHRSNNMRALQLLSHIKKPL